MHTPSVHLTLARSGGEVTSIWLAIAVLMLAVMLGGVLVVILRKRFRSGGNAGPGLGLTLADLRQMRSEGRLTDEEFERAKVMVIGELGGKVGEEQAERTRVQGRIVDGELRARPGFDLTGQPLPGFTGETGSHEPEGSDPPRPEG
jgi:hypothetical protein